MDLAERSRGERDRVRRTLAWHEWDFPDMPWDASRIVVRGVEGLAPVGSPQVLAGGDGVACGQPRFSPGDGALAFVCDRTGWMNVWVGDPEEGRKLLPAMRSLGGPVTAQETEMSYVDLQVRDDTVGRHALRRYSKGHYLVVINMGESSCQLARNSMPRPCPGFLNTRLESEVFL